jgi:prepilin-type N-terminal cleavage/methylation domain-containing protein
VLGPMAPRRRPAGRDAGFSFLEIVVVMAIAAVLVGMGAWAYRHAMRKAQVARTDALLATMRGNVMSLHARFRAYPPSDLNRLPAVAGIAIQVGRPVPPNVSNSGMESLHQALRMPGIDHNPELSDGDLSNTDHDALDRPLAPNGDAFLYEVRDAWLHPLVYFVESDYLTAEKDPPVYVNGNGDVVTPRPYRTASGTGFAQPHAYQLYSMGPDGRPNTDDDRLAWEAR